MIPIVKPMLCAAGGRTLSETDGYFYRALRILITDDHALFRSGLRALLQRTFPDVTITEAQSASATLEYVRREKWDLLIMDISLPDRSGLDALGPIKLASPTLAVLMLSGHPEDDIAIRALKAKAAGFVSKTAPPEELVRAVKKVLAGEKYISASLAEKLADALASDLEKPPHEILSEREFEVMRLLVLGVKIADIAERLSLSSKTITTYRTRVLTKLQLRSNADLTRYAMKNRLLE